MKRSRARSTKARRQGVDHARPKHRDEPLASEVVDARELGEESDAEAGKRRRARHWPIHHRVAISNHGIGTGKSSRPQADPKSVEFPFLPRSPDGIAIELRVRFVSTSTIVRNGALFEDEAFWPDL